MCKHDKRFSIIETGFEQLQFDYDDGEISNSAQPGSIDDMAVFHCWDCDRYVRFNRFKPNKKYLRDAQKKLDISAQ